MKTIQIAVITLVSLATLSSCKKDGFCVMARGGETSKTVDVSSFNSLEVHSATDVEITIGDAYSLRVEGPKKVVEKLRVEQNGQKLTIGKDNCFLKLKALKLYVTTPSLSSLALSGSSNVLTIGTIETSSFKLSSSGSSNINLNLVSENLNASVSGSAKMDLNGSATQQTYVVSGSGKIDAANLHGKFASINVSGSSRSTLNVSEKLNVKISGSGSVRYTGNPELDTDISGSGSISRY